MGIFKTIGNLVKGKATEADEALKKSQAATLGKQAIAASEQKIAEHRQRIGNFSAKIKIQQKNLEEAQADVKKWMNIANKEVQAGNTDNAKTALVEKNKAEARLTTLKSEISQNEAVLNREKTNLQTLIDKVEKAKNNFDNLSIRKEGAEMRKSQTGVNPDDNCFDALDDLEEQVEATEAEAEAYEEMSGVGNEASKLEAKYESGASDVDDELAKLIEKNKKKS